MSTNVIKRIDFGFYYKQGDDLRHCIDRTKSVKEAFEMWSNQTFAAAKGMKEIADIIGDKVIDIQADTNMICAYDIDDETLSKLIKNELVSVREEINEEYDDNFEEEK